MIARCCDPGSPIYQHYGGRGITVSPEWRNSFKAFSADMGDRLSKDYSLERIDNEKGYGAGNVRWATDAEQARNTRTNVHLTIGDRTQVLTDWLTELDIPRTVYYRRINTGMSPQEALTTARRSLKRLITFRGETRTLTDWARKTGLTRECIAGRLNSGMDISIALTEPSGLDTKPLTFNGETHTAAEWGRITRLGLLVSSRLAQGMSLERALTQPIGPQAGKRARQR